MLRKGREMEKVYAKNYSNSIAIIINEGKQLKNLIKLELL